jgi:hypothetical protein
MSARTNDLDVLKATVQLKHKCKAVHAESVRVVERSQGRTVWKGMVEVFELAGHASAMRCYAWIEIPSGAERQCVSILQKGLVISPETAVKGWLASRSVTIDPV